MWAQNHDVLIGDNNFCYYYYSNDGVHFKLNEHVSKQSYQTLRADNPLITRYELESIYYEQPFVEDFGLTELPKASRYIVPVINLRTVKRVFTR